MTRLLLDLARRRVICVETEKGVVDGGGSSGGGAREGDDGKRRGESDVDANLLFFFQGSRVPPAAETCAQRIAS